MRDTPRFRRGGTYRIPASPVLVALCILCFALIAEARVFNRWRAASDSARMLESLGGRLAYESNISLNGGDGHLKVFGFETSLADIGPRINRILGDTVFAETAGTMARGQMRTDAIGIRLLAIDLGQQGQTMVFMIEQSLSDFEKSSSPPERHMLRNVPAYPDSEPSFYAHDKNTDMALAVATSSSTPESVKAFYDAHMVAKGWKTAPEAYLATPGSDTGHPGPLPLRGFNIYLKGAALCFVLATETADRGETTISLIHKQMKMD